MLFIAFSHAEFMLAGLSALLFCVLVFYCLYFYHLPRWRDKEEVIEKHEPNNLPPVSVILYMQEDMSNIENNLAAFMEQNYLDFEVIVVVTDISDDCANLLSRLKAKYNNLYYTYTPKEAKFISKRKLALTLGIKASHNDILFFSDLASSPVSGSWLVNMVESYKDSTKIVVGATSYPYMNNWRNRFIGFDQLKYNIQFISALSKGHPYNATGKNLSYKKEFFFEHKGFYNQLHLKAGEDSMFVNEFADKVNTNVCYDFCSFIQLDEMDDIRQWTQIRVARKSISSMCKNKYYRIFKLEPLLCLLYWIISVALIVLGFKSDYLFTILSISLLFAYLVVKGVILKKDANILRQKIHWYEFVFLDLFDNIYLAYIDIIAMFRKKFNNVYVVIK